jgi:sugar phosphate isomerase/epimerase
VKISFSTLGCPGWDLATIADRASQYGYHGIDFRGLSGEMNVCKLPAFGARRDETARIISDAGLEISAFSTSARMFNQTDSAAADSLDEVKRYAELANAMGVRFIRVFGGNIGDTPRNEAVEKASETLDAFAKAAAPVIVAVETHDAWVDSSLLAAAVNGATEPNVTVLWDLHHPFRLANEPIDKTFLNIGRLTGYTHIKDSRPTPGGYQYTLPGEGDVPLAEMIEQLKRVGYDGWLTLEWEKAWRPDIAEPEIAFPAYAKFLKQFC